jgi:hypothetical protein
MASENTANGHVMPLGVEELQAFLALAEESEP